MKEALGLIETRGLSTVILVADTMVKTSNVNIIEIENTKGLGYMTIKISGNVGAVNAAITAGKQTALDNNAFVSSKVIPRPSDYIDVTFCQPKKEEIEAKDEEKPLENVVLEETPSSKEVEINSSKLVKQENKVEEKLQEVKEIKEEDNKQPIIEDKKKIEDEKKDEEKEKPNTENTQSEEKKVKKTSRKKKEPKKDSEDESKTTN